MILKEGFESSGVRTLKRPRPTALSSRPRSARKCITCQVQGAAELLSHTRSVAPPPVILSGRYGAADANLVFFHTGLDTTAWIGSSTVLWRGYLVLANGILSQSSVS